MTTTVTWKPIDGSASWTSAASWQPGTVPNADVLALFDGGLGNVVTGGGTAQELWVLGNTSMTFDGQIIATGAPFGIPSLLVDDGASATINVGYFPQFGMMLVGRQGDGTLSFGSTGFAAFSTDGFTIGVFAHSSGTVTVQGDTWQTGNQDAIVGANGHGVLQLIGGTALYLSENNEARNTLYVGRDPTGTGVVDVNMSLLVLSNDGTLALGGTNSAGGVGILNVVGPDGGSTGGVLLVQDRSQVEMQGTIQGFLGVEPFLGFTSGIIAAGGTVSGTGDIDIGSLVNDGVINSSSLNITAAITGSGVLQIENALVLSGSPSVAAGQTVAFMSGAAAGSETLTFGGTPTLFGAAITGFAPGDLIAGLGSITSLRFNQATGVLSLGGNPLHTLQFRGDFAGELFTLNPAGNLTLTHTG